MTAVDVAVRVLILLSAYQCLEYCHLLRQIDPQSSHSRVECMYEMTVMSMIGI